MLFANDATTMEEMRMEVRIALEAVEAVKE